MSNQSANDVTLLPMSFYTFGGLYNKYIFIGNVLGHDYILPSGHFMLIGQMYDQVIWVQKVRDYRVSQLPTNPLYSNKETQYMGWYSKESYMVMDWNIYGKDQHCLVGKVRENYMA